MNTEINNLSKSFDGLPVLHDFSVKLEDGNVYYLMSASGSGKTTLLRILLGLERADSDQIEMLKQTRMATVFRENCLCEGFTPLESVLLAAGRQMTSAMAQAELCKLLPEESLARPIYTQSGGMERRAAICQALLTDSDVTLMNEPLTELDEQTKQHVISYIKEKTAGKLVLITTHQEEDVSLLGGVRITLEGQAGLPEQS